MIAHKMLVCIYESKIRKRARSGTRPDPFSEPPQASDGEATDDRRAAYDALVRSWHVLLDDLPDAIGLRLRRGLAPVKFHFWPDRYPAGGGYRILRKPLPEDE